MCVSGRCVRAWADLLVSRSALFGKRRTSWDGLVNWIEFRRGVCVCVCVSHITGGTVPWICRNWASASRCRYCLADLCLCVACDVQRVRVCVQIFKQVMCCRTLEQKHHCVYIRNVWPVSVLVHRKYPATSLSFDVHLRLHKDSIYFSCIRDKVIRSLWFLQSGSSSSYWAMKRQITSWFKVFSKKKKDPIWIKLSSLNFHFIHQYFQKKTQTTFLPKTFSNGLDSRMAHNLNYSLKCFTLLLAIILSDEMSVSSGGEIFHFSRRHRRLDSLRTNSAAEY